MKALRKAVLAVIAVSLALSSCGGENKVGGGISSPPGNWDSMVWDQGNWS